MTAALTKVELYLSFTFMSSIAVVDSEAPPSLGVASERMCSGIVGIVYQLGLVSE